MFQKTFWPEATKWCVHVLNRSLTKALQDITPEEAWSGVKPSMVYFRVFGCIAHVHTPDQLRVKLDDKSKMCVLLGVTEESKAYRLCDLVKNRIIISRDVVFEERKCWNWEEIQGTNQQESLHWVIMRHGNMMLRRLSIMLLEIQEIQNNNLQSQSAELPNAGNGENNSDDLLSSDNTTQRRVRRNRRKPVWMADYERGDDISNNEDNAMIVTNDDPVTYEEAVNRFTNTWELTDLPTRMKQIGVKWIYKTKLKENGEISKQD